MTIEEMRAFAQAIVNGGPAKKAEVLAFMKAFLDPDLQAGGPSEPNPFKDLPALWFEIEKTESGIHVPREANRSYTTKEGYALVQMLVQALRTTG